MLAPGAGSGTRRPSSQFSLWLPSSVCGWELGLLHGDRDLGPWSLAEGGWGAKGCKWAWLPTGITVVFSPWCLGVGHPARWPAGTGELSWGPGALTAASPAPPPAPSSSQVELHDPPVSARPARPGQRAQCQDR